jgi:phosphatidylinositol-3,4,5-trisphosphate 3-phosphatase/dual-specificity protein phosphatase PTEN
MDENNCPPLQLVTTFCQSAYKYLKAGLENVVVVHCKGGMAHAGLMISCLLLYLKFFPTAEESVNHYNQKRSVDGKGLILPSQLVSVPSLWLVLNVHDGTSFVYS